MEDVAACVLVEHTDAGRFFRRELMQAVVVLHLALRHLFLGKRHVVVAIEVGLVRRHPVEAPSQSLLEGLDLRKRRPRHQTRHRARSDAR